MRNRVATIAAMSVLALALGASPALAGSPAEHYRSIPAGGMAFDCGSTSLLTSSGTMNIVTRTSSTASGNWTQTGTLTLHGVRAADSDGNEYKVVGVEHWGFRYNAQTGVVIANVDGVDISGGVTIFSFKFVRADGGLAGRLGLVQHGSPNGNYFEFSPGTCTFG